MKLNKYLSLLVNRISNNRRIVVTDDMPTEVFDTTIYIVGDINSPQYAIFKCPCNCGRIVELNLNSDSRPCWELKWNCDGTVSLSPSIWRTGGCKSHFYLQHSKTKWI